VILNSREHSFPDRFGKIIFAAILFLERFFGLASWWDTRAPLSAGILRGIGFCIEGL
jgi:hypothetical protein